MKCLFAMKFYSLIWHINEEAFGVRRRPGGSYRWQRCCSTPDDKHCDVLQAASPRCQSAGRSGAGTCFQEKHPPFPRKENSSNPSSVRCRCPAPTGSSTPRAPRQKQGRGTEEDAEERETPARGHKSGRGPSRREPEPASGARAAVEHRLQGGSTERPQQRAPSSSRGIRRWHQPGPLHPPHAFAKPPLLCPAARR